jgi:DNA replication and repair protein RecF
LYTEKAFTITGWVSTENNSVIVAGIEKLANNKVRFKANNEYVPASYLVKTLPLQLINPDAYELLTTGPQVRRQFIDWGVFHVEPHFLITWQRYQRALKQRNAALQQVTGIEQIKIWDQEILDTANTLAQLRGSYIQKLLPFVDHILNKLIDIKDLTISYYKGWTEEFDLQTVLSANYRRDVILGYTQYGAHKADLIIKVNEIPVADVLSRGEQKMLVCALRLAQGLLLRELMDKQCLYLLDDLASELDFNRISRIIAVLKDLQAQVFITALKREIFDAFDEDANKLFHVEQGKVK